MDVTLAFIGAILLGLGILLVLAGIGIVRIESDIKIRTGTGTAIAGMFFVVIGILVLFFRFGIGVKLNPEPTPAIQLVTAPTSVPEVVEVVTSVEEEAVEPLPEPTEIVEIASTLEPVQEPTEEVAEEPVSPTEVVPEAPTTLTEEVVGTETTVKLQTTATNVIIYAGPSDVNPHLGLLNYNDELEVLGKVRGSIWYRVKAETDVVGWVDANQVEFISGSDEEVPETWPLTASENTQSDTITTKTCMSTAVERDAVGTVFIKWSNLPEDARWLYLTIRGELNGEMTDLIQPNNKIDVNDRDTAARGFELGSYLFNPDDPSSKGFPTGTNFNYTLQAQDTDGSSLCVVSGNFQ